MNEALVIAGGLYNLVFAVFHLLFWRIFGWREDLRSLRFVNRAIMQVLNLCLTFAFVIFAVVSLGHTEELLTTGLGHSLLALFALFWLARAIEQIVFFELRSRVSWVFLALFLVGTALYAVPAIHVLFIEAAT